MDERMDGWEHTEGETVSVEGHSDKERMASDPMFKLEHSVQDEEKVTEETPRLDLLQVCTFFSLSLSHTHIHMYIHTHTNIHTLILVIYTYTHVHTNVLINVNTHIHVYTELTR